MAVRASPDSPRRRHRNREASETRFAQTADASLSDFGTGDAAPSTGIYCNGNGHFTSNDNDNGNDPRPTRVPLRYTRCASTQGERRVKKA